MGSTAKNTSSQPHYPPQHHSRSSKIQSSKIAANIKKVNNIPPQFRGDILFTLMRMTRGRSWHSYQEFAQYG